MSTRVGINGFGRIGRNAFRAMLGNPGLNLDVVAVNDLTDPNTLAHLLKYDSVHGILDDEISATESGLLINGNELTVLSERDPADLPWGELEVGIVIESTGFLLNGPMPKSTFYQVVQRRCLFQHLLRVRISLLSLGLTTTNTIQKSIILFLMLLVLQTVSRRWLKY